MVISGQSDRLVLTDSAGPQEQLRVKAAVELGAGTGHCYGGQSARSGVGDVADVGCDGFKISAAHCGLLVIHGNAIIAHRDFLVNRGG